jgi:hypothetical protein
MQATPHQLAWSFFESEVWLLINIHFPFENSSIEIQHLLNQLSSNQLFRSDLAGIKVVFCKFLNSFELNMLKEKLTVWVTSALAVEQLKLCVLLSCLLERRQVPTDLLRYNRLFWVNTLRNLFNQALTAHRVNATSYGKVFFAELLHLRHDAAVEWDRRWLFLLAVATTAC